MEVGLAILLFVCMTALLYVLLSLKITRQVDLQMKEFYKTRIHSDIQEFYREMEGYAALMENRIQRFKSLVERSETVELKYAPLHGAEQLAGAVAQTRPEEQRPGSKGMPAKSSQRSVAPEKKKALARAEKKNARTVTAKASGNKVVARSAPVKAAAAPRLPKPEIRHESGHTMPLPGEDSSLEADTTIAAELMKDLFAQDEVRLTRSVTPAETKMQPPVQAESTTGAEGERLSATNIFARIGKALEPVVFGDKAHPKVAVQKNAQQLSTAREAEVPGKNGDFAEILRRAEQIKAEKKAERERAEIDARAEFYISGDTFAASPREDRNFTARVPLRSSVNEGIPAAGNAANSAGPMETRREAPVRNNLAVKSLDEHTISFLIDSLKHDAGYRKQALRALTENNIPLEEIARLSRIDIGELQLMRQLGKF